MTDPATQSIPTEDGNDPASEFIQSMITALPGANAVGKSRAAHLQWYESLSEENQMHVRDKLREEIAKVREQFGKRSNVFSAQSVRLRDHG